MMSVFKKAKEAVKSKWPGFKEKAGKVLGEIPELFFVNGVHEVYPSPLIIIIILILMFLFREKIIGGVDNLVDLIRK